MTQYGTARTERQRRAVVAAAQPEVAGADADLRRWVEELARVAHLATGEFQSTARRMATLLIGVVVAVMLVGVVVWLMLERLRSRLFHHVDVVRHEQAGLRRVAEMVAAEESEHTVLSAVAQEMVALTGAGGGWVVRIEGSRAYIHGSALPSAPLRLRMDGAESFSLVPGGAIERSQATASPRRSAVDRQGMLPESVERLRSLGLAVVAAAPIHASGRLWGALVAASAAPGDLPPGSEDQLTPFARLAGLAITGAQGREALTARANSDALTGLPNHRAFHERLSHVVSAGRATEEPVSVVFVDLDLLTDVNARDGHQEGDRVLAGVARRLAPLTPERGLLARIGGEEFAWLLPGVRMNAALRLADRARRVVSAAPLGAGSEITVSAGVCDTTLATDATGLCDAADAALMVAKADGRNRVVAFAPEFLSRAGVEGRQRRAERARTLVAVRALARAVDARDPATQRHSERVAAVTHRIALAAGWTADRADQLREAALVHDVGKIGVPDDVLRKPGGLTAEEFAQIAAHAPLGATIVADVLTPEQTGWVRHHHERVDGTGYPDGLGGDAIPEGARIMAIADAWDAMTADRPYRRALAPATALVEARRAAGTQLDARLVMIALPVLREAAEAGVEAPDAVVD